MVKKIGEETRNKRNVDRQQNVSLCGKPHPPLNGKYNLDLYFDCLFDFPGNNSEQ